ncbi:MAG TPA: TIR domain-containing protein [Myxococcaceae bacterium]|nr:TIR domain-containing protein [Myxococcaceae bacterium]
MSKNIFISYKFSEKNWKDNGLQFFNAHEGRAQATPVTIEAGEIEAPTKAKIQDAITAKLKSAAALLVVVGNQGLSDWVEYEVGVALTLNKPIAYTRHPQSSGALPSNAQNNPKVRQIDWSQEAIAGWVASL